MHKTLPAPCTAISLTRACSMTRRGSSPGPSTLAHTSQMDGRSAHRPREIAPPSPHTPCMRPTRPQSPCPPCGHARARARARARPLHPDPSAYTTHPNTFPHSHTCHPHHPPRQSPFPPPHHFHPSVTPATPVTAPYPKPNPAPAEVSQSPSGAPSPRKPLAYTTHPPQHLACTHPAPTSDVTSTVTPDGGYT